MFGTWQGSRVAWLRATQRRKQLDFAHSTCKIYKIGQKLNEILRYKIRIILIEINCVNPLNFMILWGKKGNKEC
jgi:hypothetical protein